jgi:beta-N-acetylhexosaminidase
MSRIDDAVRRLLTLKKARGLFEAQAATLESAKIVGSAGHRAIELRTASSAISLIRDRAGLLPLQADVRTVLVNATPRASYEILGRTRGIGPNQTTPAFDVFAEHLRAARPDVQVFHYEELNEHAPLPTAMHEANVVLAVTENYLIPGADFNVHDQMSLVNRLSTEVGSRLAVIALRDPYELAELAGMGTYLCTFSSRPCAAQAAAGVVLGHASPRGKSPVSIPQG